LHEDPPHLSIGFSSGRWGEMIMILPTQVQFPQGTWLQSLLLTGLVLWPSLKISRSTRRFSLRKFLREKKGPPRFLMHPKIILFLVQTLFYGSYIFSFCVCVSLFYNLYIVLNIWISFLVILGNLNVLVDNFCWCFRWSLLYISTCMDDHAPCLFFSNAMGLLSILLQMVKWHDTCNACNLYFWVLNYYYLWLQSS